MKKDQRELAIAWTNIFRTVIKAHGETMTTVDPKGSLPDILGATNYIFLNMKESLKND